MPETSHIIRIRTRWHKRIKRFFARLSDWGKTPIDIDIDRLFNAIRRGEEECDRASGPRKWPIEDKQERRRQWLVILLRKRGRPHDIKLADAIAIDAYDFVIKP